MRDTDDPDLIAYLEAENEYSTRWFDSRRDLTDAIFHEIRSRVQEDDVSAPVPHGGWFYASRTVEGLSYPIHQRGRSADDATDATRAEVVLDENIEAAGHEHFDLGAFEVTADHRRLAWAADTNGDEHYTLRIRDLHTGIDLPDVVDDTAWAGLMWSTDGEVILYVVADEAERPHQVRAHRLGTPSTDDVVVHTEDDGRFHVSIHPTRRGRLGIIHCASRTTSEVHLVDLGHPTLHPVLVRRREDGVEYHVDDWGDRLVITTNLEAEDFRIMTADPSAPSEWAEFDPPSPGRRITGVECFADVLAIHEWAEAQPRVRLLDRARSSRSIHIADEPHDVEFGPNEDWEARSVRLVHQSLTMPMRVLDVDLASLGITEVRRIPTPGVELGDYVADRRWATSHDGTRVPYDILRRADTPLDGTAPALIYGYGSYEVSLPPWFSVARLSLVDRGVVWVLAHPRGGGELGRGWYLEGRLTSKRNTFYDTLAIAADLAPLVDPTRIGIRGGSAGGLLVGACITMRPDLFATAVAEVPFVDIVSTMSDPTLPLTINEWEEWGDPRSEPYATYMSSYSPYDNTDPTGERPAIYVTAGLNDPRVSVHEPAKWVALMRLGGPRDRPLLLHTEMGAGHAGPSGRYESWRDEARTLTFILDTLRPAGTAVVTS
jgi:oligopeptidase B